MDSFDQQAWMARTLLLNSTANHDPPRGVSPSCGDQVWMNLSAIGGAVLIILIWYWACELSCRRSAKRMKHDGVS